VTGFPRDRAAWALAAIALLVYLPGLTWGLPHATGPAMIRGWDVDGIAGVGVLSEFYNLLRGPRPDWYTAYPLIHYLVLGALYAPYLAWLKLTGGLGALSGTYPFGFADPVTAIATMGILARTVTLLMAAATVAMVYRLGRRLEDERSGLIAASLFLVTGPTFYYAHTSNLDVPVQFWTTMGLLVAVDVLEHGLSSRRAIWLGVLAGLAVGTKDQAYGAWIGGLLFVVVRHLRSPQPAPAERWRAPLLLGASGLVVFLLANGFPFRPARLASHLQYLTGFEGSFFNLQHPSFLTVLRPATPAGYLQLLGDIARAVLEAAGTPTVLLGIAGLVGAWRSRPGVQLLGWMLAGFLLLVMLPIRHMQYRYAMLPAMVLSLGAGIALARGSARRGRLMAAVFAIALVWSGTKAADLLWQMLGDARIPAGEWLAAEARPGDRLGYFGSRHQLPYLPAGLEPELLADSTATADLARHDIRFILVAPDFFSDTARVRSTFLPEPIYRGLESGELGYQRVARFRSAPLLPRPLPYFPYVNPMVQIFALRR
jgi:4-amino-4-deoxy-L-arabinose transferase-like glycosyltransferase